MWSSERQNWLFCALQFASIAKVPHAPIRRSGVRQGAWPTTFRSRCWAAAFRSVAVVLRRPAGSPGSGRTGRRQVPTSAADRRGGRGVGDDGTVESLTQLREQRAFLCRLSPDRALGSVEEADTFLRDRGLLTRTADCALPSLYEACHEDPYQPGRPGFATWPATKWPWFGELADRGHLITAVHRGKSLLISGAVARLLDPICRAEITRMGTADRGWGGSGSPGRRRAVQHRGPAHGTRAQAAGTEGAAGTAGAARRDRVTIAARHCRPGTSALQ